MAGASQFHFHSCLRPYLCYRLRVTNQKKIICIVTPCFNEAENIVPLYEAIKQETAKLSNYEFLHLFVDNDSTDASQLCIRELTDRDPKVLGIFNARNFGHIRSPFYGILQVDADATILMASDFQDPVSLIPQFIAEWEKGFKVVMAVKSQSDESPLFYRVRKAYYDAVRKIASIKLVKNYTGTGLYDHDVIRELRQIEDPYPYFRGLIPDLGFHSSEIHFKQPVRTRGFSKNNFYTLYDMGWLGITSHSRVPLRMATILGFVFSVISFLIACGYLVVKLLFWDKFAFGLAPMLIGMFLLGSVQILFIGVLGEYIGAILTQVQKRPLVVEKIRLNFSKASANLSRELALPRKESELKNR